MKSIIWIFTRKEQIPWLNTSIGKRPEIMLKSVILPKTWIKMDSKDNGRDGLILEAGDSWCCVESLAWGETGNCQWGKELLEGIPLGNAWALDNLEEGNWARSVVLDNQGQQRWESALLISLCMQLITAHLGNAGKLPRDGAVSPLDKCD